MQADQVDQARARLFKLGAQELAAKVAGNLHHAFGRLLAHGLDSVVRDDAVLHTIGQGFFKERPGVKQGDGGHGC